MGYYFSGDFTGPRFEMFSTTHILTLVVILLILLAMYVFRDKFKSKKVNKYSRYTLAALLILQELSLNIWRLAVNDWTLQESLPLHLCGLAIICSAFMLVLKKYSIYELVYFWGLGGAVQALLTPDITDFGFPHYRFFQYFLSHGLIIIAALFMTFVEEYRPTFQSLKKTLLLTNIYMVFIAMFNLLTGSNYLYICYKPVTGSLLDFLGPWPWYILSLEGVAVVIFMIVYIPFFIHDTYYKTRQKHLFARETVR